MADPRGFIKYERKVAERRPVEERIHDWKEVYPGSPGRALLPIISEQAGRCMDCGIPFCHTGCPLGNLIPEWNDLVWRSDWEEALERLHATNNFPEFTGRLCPAPCETACVVGINRDPVTIKNVEVAIIDKAWDERRVTAQPPEWHTGRTVAVVGSGPAGLAVAQQLTRAGHTVAVFERADAPGGLMRYGIPEFKMEKAVLDRRIRQMKDEGTNFRCGVEVGVSVTGHELKKRYDAVVLATGSTVGRDLPVPGRELNGIHQAMEFLPQANRVARGGTVENQITAAGKHVVIIGGGDTGADCLGTAIRQGAKSITQLEIMPTPPDERPAHQPWPTYPMTYRVSSAHEEAGERVYSVSTSEFLGDSDGNVSKLMLSEVKFDAGRVVPVEGTEQGAAGPARAAGHGLRGTGARHHPGPAGGEPGRARQRGPRRQLRHRRRRGLRLRRRRPRPVADRLGHRRGTGLRRRGGRVPQRLDQAAEADPADRATDDGVSAPRRSGAAIELSGELLDLLRGSSLCYLATSMPDGSPQLTQTWVDTDGRHVLINTVAGFQKVRNIERDPRVALTVSDPKRPGRFFQVRGTVQRVTAEGAAEHIESLAQRYLGGPYPWFGGRDQVRLLVEIRPEKVTSQGH